VREALRAAQQAVFPWDVENVARSRATWPDRGGRILKLPPDEQARMMERFAAIGTTMVAADPGVRAEYDRSMAVLEGERGG
jgi:hypothetical protein